MHCHGDLINYLSCGMILTAFGYLVHHRKTQTSYGRHMSHSSSDRMVPARLAWFFQELPSVLIPLLLMLTSHKPFGTGKYLLLGTFFMHYFQRWKHWKRSFGKIYCCYNLEAKPLRGMHWTFVYSLLTRGKPFPLSVMAGAGLFCSINGFLQGHHLLHCAKFDDGWSADYRCKTGLLLFYTGMAINIHSDHILRNLRKPGEEVYRIPAGGLFEYVSAANYLGEIVEWFGYAVATWSLPALSFAVFSLCFLGPRACYHHRFYREKFKNYPRIRKALIPFIF